MGYECLLALDKKYGDELKNATLILGNGSSISYSSKFAYSSLYDEAAFTDEEKRLFDEFKTTQTSHMTNTVIALVCKPFGRKYIHTADTCRASRIYCGSRFTKSARTTWICFSVA